MKTSINLHETFIPAKADYDFEIIDRGGRKLIEIVDLDRGNLSVTNDLEQVLREIGRELNPRKLTDFDIVYRDSSGEWDQVIIKPREGYAWIFEVDVMPGRGGT